MSFILAVVGRYLFSSRGDRLFGFVTIFSVVGIAIGVAAINTVQAAQNGVIAQTLTEARRGIPDMTIRVAGGSFAADPSLLDALSDVQGINGVSAFVEGQAAGSLNGRTQPLLMRGVEREGALSLASIDPMPPEFQPPRWLVVLPFGMQRRLGAYTGANIELISADGETSALGWLPRTRDFDVFGFHNQGGSTPLMFVPIEEAQIYLRLKGRWTGLALELGESVTGNEAEIAALRARLTRWFQDNNHVAANDLTLETWQDVNVVQADVFRVMKRVMSIVLALIMVIAGFNILASQLMLVREKRMSIAVFRTMGTGRAQLVWIFVMIGLAIGLGGVLTGMALTALFGWLASALGVAIPLLYSAGDVGLIAAIAVGVCFLATLYPAMRAASIDPAIALRDA